MTWPLSAKHDLTIQLDTEIILKAKDLAEHRSIPVSQLIEEALEHILDDDYDAARQRAIRAMDEGFHLGGGLLPKRDELYDR